MNILLVTGPLWPRIGNNANLVSKLLPLLTKDHRVRILSPAFQASEKLPASLFDVPVHWVVDENTGPLRKLWFRFRAKMMEEPGYTGELGARLLQAAAERLRRTDFPFEAVLCTMQPYPGLLAVSRLRSVRKTVYLMDPPDFTLEDPSVKSNQRQIISGLRRMDAILTTPFILDAIKAKGMDALAEKSTAVSFPHIEACSVKPSEKDIPMDPEKINLLYCGALFPSVRNPDLFLRTLELLDDRFCVTFMGRNILQFWKENAVSTRAEVRALPEQPYQIAVNAMYNADCLINIGNNMRVHMPSKTLDYINTGKPIINFFKFSDCPTLYYTKRYPLCLNLLESELQPEEVLRQLVGFCEKNRGKLVPRNVIEERFFDCKPDAIAATVEETIKTNHPRRSNSKAM